MNYLNNPGNIRYNPDFQGVIGQKNGFSEFSNLYYGYRAILTVLTTYLTRYGLNTISKIITRYAPPNENKTSVYIDFVSTYTGIDKNQVLSVSDLVKLLPAIVKMENGISITRPEIENILEEKGTGLFSPFLVLSIFLGFIFLINRK